MTLPAGDVPGPTLLYRRVPPAWLTEDEDLGCIRLSSAAFRDKEASVFLDDTMEALAKTPDDILVGTHANYYLVSVTAQEAVDLGQNVLRSPIEGVPDDDIRRAHGDIAGPKERKHEGVKIKERLRRRARWVVAPPNACPDAAGNTG